MTALSAATYAVWVIGAALLCRALALCRTPEAKPAKGVAAALWAAILVFPAFWVIPPGSLPPFLDLSPGGVLFLVCLLASLVLARKKEGAAAGFFILVTAAVFFWYAWRRGMPGSATNLGTFAAMPVWTIASSGELGGFCLLCAGACCTVRLLAASEETASVAGSLQLLAVCALYVTLFLPWNSASFAQWPDAAVAGCDFLLFWLKVYLLGFGGVFLPVSQRAALMLSGVCCVLGSALIFAVTP